MWPFPWMMHKRRGLRMWIVSMLATAPRNGVEIMNEIESMTRGWWRPSPGSVYPLLEELTKEGFIRRREDSRYELAEKATKELEWSFGPALKKPLTAEVMLAEISGYVSYLEDLMKTDRSKIAPYLDKIKGIEERLSALLRAKK